MKLLEVRQKYSAASRIFNSLLSVSSSNETLRLTPYTLLVFSVKPFKIVQNKNQNRLMDKVRNLGMKGGEYTKFLAKIQARRISRIRDIRRKCFTQIYGDLYGDAMLVPTWIGTSSGGRKPTETSVTEFCYKSVNFSLEELINSKVMLFLIH